MPRTRRRALLALLVGGLSSGGNFLLAVTVARLESIGGVGQYALAFSFYVLGSGLVRSTVTDTVLVAGSGAALAARRVTLLGAVGGASLAAVGAAYGSTYLAVAGIALPGLALYDYTKAIAVGIGNPTRAIGQEIAWSVLTCAAALGGLAGLIDAPVVFAGWAVGGALIGVAAAACHRYNLLPGWSAGRAETRVALGFGAQFLLTTGSAQLALTAVAAAAGTAIVGALSAGRTLLGPVNLVLSMAATLILPQLARTRQEPGPVRRRAAYRLTSLIAGGVLPLTAAVALLPDSLGTTLLGANWTVARSLLPLLALESLLAVPAAIGFAGLRVERASWRAIVLGVAVGVLRVPVVVGGAVLLGATGAAGALALLALVSGLAWSVGYLMLLRDRTVRPPVDESRAARREPAPPPSSPQLRPARRRWAG